MSITAKSVILDMADNWGDSLWLGLRSVDFFLAGTLIGITTEFTAYHTSSEYSLAYGAKFAFDTSRSKIGSDGYKSWYANSPIKTNQRIIVVFNTTTEFDTIVVNNQHASGGVTSRGVRNVVITSSTDAITDTTYNATVANSTVLFNGEFNEHIASDVEDPQEVYFPPILKGVFVSPLISVAGVGDTPVTGYTDVISPLVSVDATGETPITGYTDVVSPLVSVFSDGVIAITGYTDVISPLVEVFGDGESAITGYNDFISPIISVDGFGESAIKGYTDVISPLGAVSGEVYFYSGSTSITSAVVGINLTAIIHTVGWFDIATKSPSIVSAGVNAIRGTGYVKPKRVKIQGNYSAVGNVEASAEVDSYGKVSIIGAGALAVSPPVSAGSGQLSLLATADYEVSPPAVTSTGIIYQTGKGALSVPLPDISTYGYLTSTGTCVFNVKPPTVFCQANQPDGYTVIRHSREGTCH